MDDNIIAKIINADPETYVIFFVYECPYCENSLELLRNKKVPYKGYDINSINGGFNKLIQTLSDNSAVIGFDINHKTKPIIFKSGHFLGGFNDLVLHLSK